MKYKPSFTVIRRLMDNFYLNWLDKSSRLAVPLLDYRQQPSTGNKGAKPVAKDRQDHSDPQIKAITFTMSMIGLMANYRHTDYATHRHINSIPHFWQHAQKIGKPLILLKQAKEDGVTQDIHAARILRLFPDNQALLLEAMQTLVRYSLGSDHMLTHQQYYYLFHIASSWRISQIELVTLFRKQLLPHSQDPYQLLGINKKQLNKDQLKKIYYQHIKRCHPDRLCPKTIPGDLIAIEQERFAIYSKAYQYLLNQARQPEIVRRITMIFGK